MSNLTAYAWNSTESMFPVPNANHGALCSTNSSMYLMVLQMLTQLLTTQSGCSTRKFNGTSFQSSFQREHKLRLQDKLKFHSLEQQLLKKIEGLHTKLNKTREALHHKKHNLSACRNPSLHVLEKNDQMLIETKEKSKQSQEELQDTSKTMNDKDIHLEDIRNEVNTPEKGLQLAEAAFGSFKALELENEPMLERSLNVREANSFVPAPLNEELILQRDEGPNVLTDLTNSSKEEKYESGEEVNVSKQRSLKKERIDKVRKALERKLTRMQVEITPGTANNFDVTEELKTFKDGVLKDMSAELEIVLKETISLMSNFTKQLLLNEELRKSNEELEKEMADLINQFEEEKRRLLEDLKKCKEVSESDLGACGPVVLQKIKMPEPEPGDGMYKAVLKYSMQTENMVHIVGKFKASGDYPYIYLDHPFGIPLSTIFGFSESTISRNSYLDCTWGKNETCGGWPVKLGEYFTATITAKPDYFINCYNGSPINFKHRVPSDQITSITIGGIIEEKKVQYLVPASLH